MTCAAEHGSYSGAGTCVDCEIPVMARNNYFTGKLMVERDFRDEQGYFIGKDRRHDQYLHGWGAVCGGTRDLFTTLSAPVMTRLRQPERLVLDTLVDAGVARSRSDALAWCVHLVGQHAEAWLNELRDAMGAVDELRRRGPQT